MLLGGSIGYSGIFTHCKAEKCGTWHDMTEKMTFRKSHRNHHDVAVFRCSFDETYNLCRYDVDSAVKDGCTDVWDAHWEASTSPQFDCVEKAAFSIFESPLCVLIFSTFELLMVWKDYKSDLILIKMGKHHVQTSSNYSGQRLWSC